MFELLHLQNPYFYLFENVLKLPKEDIQKAKAMYENRTIKLVLKRCQTFFMFLQVKTQQNRTERFRYRIPFDSCLIMKNWIPQK